MGKYRKIDPRIWNDEKFNSFSDRGKLSFLFILTHPSMTSLGAMRATIPGLTAELGWQDKAFREAFREAFEMGMVKHDEKACFLWVPNFLKYNGPESPNVVKSWGIALDLLPECSLKIELIQSVKAFTEALPKAFTEALPKAFIEALPKGFAKSTPNQEQEQEQELEQEIPPHSPPYGVDAASRNQKPSSNNGFDEFWKSYPRKVGKDKALHAWKKRQKDIPPIGAVLSVLAWQVQSVEWLKEDGRFIPNPATYINQGRWSDEQPVRGQPTTPTQPSLDERIRNQPPIEELLN